ncbi:hypothetical protein C2845_PM02G18050 [Panicum miliaceum]|uniref:Uncharacterized protein n=1 Tax=Panicum miliaceum TaxID=4540 RepID=A0A3L6S583_PANMI|nr:hypothetical protein C2845_PM02G18050 [Panicum miliaceum]
MKLASSSTSPTHVSPSPSPARTAAGRTPPPPQPRRLLRGLTEARQPQGRRRRGVPRLPTLFPSSSRSRSSFVGDGGGNAGVGSGGWRLPMAGARRLPARLPVAGARRLVARLWRRPVADGLQHTCLPRHATAVVAAGQPGARSGSPRRVVGNGGARLSPGSPLLVGHGGGALPDPGVPYHGGGGGW